MRKAMKNADFAAMLDGYNDRRRYLTRLYKKTESLPEMHLWNQDETKQITITVESTDDGDWVIGELRNGTSTITLFKTKF